MPHPPTGLGCCILALALVCGLTCVPTQTVAREVYSFDDGWRFKMWDPPDTKGLSYTELRPWLLAVGKTFTTNPVLRSHMPPAGNPGADVPYVQPGFDDSDWRAVDLPHDWGIESQFKQEYPGATGKLPWWGVGWYRKQFFVPETDREKRIYLEFDGAMSHAVVWVNGRFVGGWPYGYASFRLDLTPHLIFGWTNVVAVRLDNPPDSSRWYPGGGIYRHTRLIKTAPVHVAQWGTFVTTSEITPDFARVQLRATVENHTTNEVNATIRNEIHFLGMPGPLIPEAPEAQPRPHKHELDRGTEPAMAPQPLDPVQVRIPAGGQARVLASGCVPEPRLWSPDSPHLYKLVTTVHVAGREVDRYETVFGIRTVRFDPELGLVLNGRPVKIKGVCNHHDLGPLGAAVNTSALERQIRLLKEMGANAIRTSHNPPAPELLDLCDRWGIMVLDEAFDCWRKGKTKNDYHLRFDDWFEKDLRALVRRDRNHPCVILWSIGNEILEQGQQDGWKLAALLRDICRQEDPTRLVTAGLNIPQSESNGFQNVVDVFGFNYKPHRYAPFHKANPDKPVVATETASCVSSRGEYFFPVTTNKLEGRANFHVSSYDLYAPPWAFPPDVEFRGLDENPFVAGEFVWTGFDYLGEPTPYDSDSHEMLVFTDPATAAERAEQLRTLGRILVPSRSSYFGIMDLCGFPKDRFYLYQARWRPELPMVHILPHWNWPERVGQITPVHVYTSGDEVELFLNGRSLGRQHRGQFQYRFVWDNVIYEPGELRAVVYKGGKPWAERTVRTTGAPAAVKLAPDRSRIRADGRELAFVTVSVVDTNGLVVPRSKHPVRFYIRGPGSIVAVGNGDPTSHEPFLARECRVFNGLALVIVRGERGMPGTITLEAESEDLATGTVSITTVEPDTRGGPRF